MAYIGSSAAPIPVAFAAVQSQSFNGTGSQTAFTINRSVPSAASLEILVDNVQQSPYDGSYSVNGTTLTFSEAPSSGTNNVYVIYRDQALGSLVDSGAVRKAGDTMTGTLQVPQLDIGSRKQFDLTNLGDETNINWNNVTRNSISYALGSAHTNAPLQGVNSIVVDLNTEGWGGANNTASDSRGAQLWFTDIVGGQDGGTTGRFAVRTKQGTTQNPWEKILTTYSFRRNLAIQSGTQLITGSSWVDINGCSVTVTPISSNSRFLLMARWGGYFNPSGDAQGRILRNGTEIYANGRVAGNANTQHESSSQWWLDTPSTTSVLTYKLQGSMTGSTGSMDYGHAGNLCSLLIMEFEG
jgi:hypothetical protein